jgi:hypothetical protein
LTFDATSADEARDLAAALERDEVSERQRKQLEASGHYVSFDPVPPRFFSVVYRPNPSDE